jgi:hypothetical protein
MNQTIVKTNDALDLIRWGLASRNQRVHDAAMSLYSYSILKLKNFEFEVPNELAEHHDVLQAYKDNKHLGTYEIDMEEEEDADGTNGE